ncbi:hypothetical protein GCM10027168_11130 [Streptomyces capparidis]
MLAGADFPWWIAGGYAVELAIGRTVRRHADIDVLVLRRDQHRLRRHLAGWDLHLVDPCGAGPLGPWPSGEPIPPAVRDLWCRRTPSDPWSVEVTLGETEGETWVSRRDPRIRRPLAALGRTSPTGIPHLNLAVLMLHKIRATREKDHVDFRAALPFLDADDRRWLVHCIDLTDPRHPWREHLARPRDHHREDV